MTAWRFLVLGPLEARRDGEPLALGGPKQRSVLALLLLEAGHLVPANQIIEHVWGVDGAEGAQASLQVYVSTLRKLLRDPGAESDDRLAFVRPGYRLRVAPGELDLQEADDVLVQARELRAAGDLTAAAHLLRFGLSLWRGRALGDLAELPAFAPLLVGLDRRREVLRHECYDVELDLGRHLTLVPELEAAVAGSPLDERLAGQHMVALYRSGRQADALEVYRHGRETLVEELGLEPSPILRAVHASILRHETFAASRGTIPEREHFEEVAAQILAGKVTIVVGSGSEPLASELARRFGLEEEVSPELARVSQAVAVLNGAGQLYDTLHTLVELDGEPTPVHRFLAGLPALLRDRQAAQPLLVTTGYELALERALEERDEAYDTVCYLAAGAMRGSFCHIEPGGAATVIERPNSYTRELDLDARTVLLHLQGRVDGTSERAWESFAVTEDDFINYGDVARRLPVGLAARLRRTHLLLLGYTLSTWTLRVVLERLWGSEPLAYRSWSVNAGPQPLEREFWRRRDVDVVDMAPAAYVAELERALAEAAQ